MIQLIILSLTVTALPSFDTKHVGRLTRTPFKNFFPLGFAISKGVKNPC